VKKSKKYLSRGAFLHSLLAVMEKKDHWAWPAFTSGMVPKRLLHIHFEQEYATYVRDFPVMVGWAYVQCPIAEVRRALAENLFEEETGGLVAERPHPELFLEYPRGLGMNLRRFENVKLMPTAKGYRKFLDSAIQRRGWDIAAALVTLFIEGTKDDRAAVDPKARLRVAALSDHPLVLHYDLPVEHLALTKAHRQVERDHRLAAWSAILDHVPSARRTLVVAAMHRALIFWLAYRDQVAAACGIERGPDGRPRLARW
jgi:pyrroloquinoline quinone (PQQ) biosynthesis protein C